MKANNAKFGKLAPTDLISPDHRAYVVINWESGTVSCVTLHDSENAVPPDVWYSRTTRSPLPGNVNAEALSQRIRRREFDPIINHIRSGFSQVYTGSNYVGRFTEEAQGLIDNLEAIFASAAELEEGKGVWAADAWFGDTTADELGVTSETSDGQLLAIASDLESKYREDNIVLSGTLDYLESVRNDLREAENG